MVFIGVFILSVMVFVIFCNCLVYMVIMVLSILSCLISGVLENVVKVLFVVFVVRFIFVLLENSKILEFFFVVGLIIFCLMLLFIGFIYCLLMNVWWR